MRARSARYFACQTLSNKGPVVAIRTDEVTPARGGALFNGESGADVVAGRLLRLHRDDYLPLAVQRDGIGLELRAFAA
jgi:hypothetical protein